jgi:hypothetical protein
MRHPDLLALLRKSGRTNEEMAEICEALASSLPPDDEAGDALGICADRIREVQARADELAAWALARDRTIARAEGREVMS